MPRTAVFEILLDKHQEMQNIGTKLSNITLFLFDFKTSETFVSIERELCELKFWVSELECLQVFGTLVYLESRIDVLIFYQIPHGFNARVNIN